MRAVERRGDLGGVPQRVFQWQGALGEPRLERLPLDILHHQILRRLPGARRRDQGADVVQRANVWMVQRGHGPRFAFEPLARLRVVRHVRWQDLDRHRAVQAGITRAIDLAHAAGTEQ